jgi:hypothetical protein
LASSQLVISLQYRLPPQAKWLLEGGAAMGAPAAGELDTGDALAFPPCRHSHGGIRSASGNPHSPRLAALA